jgi:hypothetical protein
MQTYPKFRHKCELCHFIGHAHGMDFYIHNGMNIVCRFGNGDINTYGWPLSVVPQLAEGADLNEPISLAYNIAKATGEYEGLVKNKLIRMH